MSTLSKFSRINFEEWGGTASVEGGTPIMTLDYNDKINFAIYTNVLSPPTFRIINFPRYTGFNNKVFTYTLGIKQNSTPQVPGNFSIVLPGGAATKFFTVANGGLLWQGGTAPTGNANQWDFFNFILINTGVPGGNVNGSSFDGYECFANLNGNYPFTP